MIHLSLGAIVSVARSRSKGSVQSPFKVPGLSFVPLPVPPPLPVLGRGGFFTTTLSAAVSDCFGGEKAALTAARAQCSAVFCVLG